MTSCALDAETEIVMTSVQSMEGVPLTGPVFAVQLEPSGLIFNKLATLTVVPSATIPMEDQLIFNYQGTGSDLHLALIDAESSEIQILLTGFSGHGVTTADMANWRMGRAQSASIRLKQVIAAMQHGLGGCAWERPNFPVIPRNKISTPARLSPFQPRPHFRNVPEAGGIAARSHGGTPT